MTRTNEPYIPAAHFDWLTPLYDPVVRWVMREGGFKRQFVSQTGIKPDMVLLDLGCGTGTLTTMLAQASPQATIHGLDGDAAVLAIAEKKAQRVGVNIAWTRGFSFDLPYPNQCFHRVTASLMLHHLNRDQKQRTISEAWRVLRPNGELHIVDFGPPHSLFSAGICLVIRHLEEIADNVDGLLPTLLNEGGFVESGEYGHWATVLGPLSFLGAVKTDEAV